MRFRLTMEAAEELIQRRPSLNKSHSVLGSKDVLIDCRRPGTLSGISACRWGVAIPQLSVSQPFLEYFSPSTDKRLRHSELSSDRPVREVYRIGLYETTINQQPLLCVTQCP